MNKILSVDVRPAVSSDTSSIFAMGVQIFSEESFENYFKYLSKKYRPQYMVAQHNGQVVGFAIYKLYPGRIHLFIVAVHPDWRRKGIGSRMLEMIITKLNLKKPLITMEEVRDGNLGFHLFLRDFRKKIGKSGFIATKVIWGFFEDTGEDAYVFKFFPFMFGN